MTTAREYKLPLPRYVDDLEGGGLLQRLDALGYLHPKASLPTLPRYFPAREGESCMCVCNQNYLAAAAVTAYRCIVNVCLHVRVRVTSAPHTFASMP